MCQVEGTLAGERSHFFILFYMVFTDSARRKPLLKTLKLLQEAQCNAFGLTSYSSVHPFWRQVGFFMH